MGTWGGSAAVADLGIRIYFLHKAFPDIVGTDYTLRAANYLLGCPRAGFVARCADQTEAAVLR
jgi:hypothetical protein